MADKWNSDQDEPVTTGSDEEIRGVGDDDDDDEFDPAEDVDEEEDEESSTF